MKSGGEPRLLACECRNLSGVPLKPRHETSTCHQSVWSSVDLSKLFFFRTSHTCARPLGHWLQIQNKQIFTNVCEVDGVKLLQCQVVPKCNCVNHSYRLWFILIDRKFKILAFAFNFGESWNNCVFKWCFAKETEIYRASAHARILIGWDQSTFKTWT